MMSVMAFVAFIFLFFFFSNVLSQSSRVTDKIQLLYTFREGGGGIIRDASAIDESPIDSSFTPTSNFFLSSSRFFKAGCTSTILSDCLQAKATTAISLAKVSGAVEATNELTIEMLFKPDRSLQTGTLVAWRGATSACSDKSFIFRQINRIISAGITTSLNADLITCSYDSPTDPRILDYVDTPSRLAHAFIRYSNGTFTVTVRTSNAMLEQVLRAQSSSAVLSFDTFDTLTLANEPTGDSKWLGELYTFAIYSKALSAVEMNRNFQVGVNLAISVSNVPIRVRPVITAFAVQLSVFDPADRPSLFIKIVQPPVHGTIRHPVTNQPLVVNTEYSISKPYSLIYEPLSTLATATAAANTVTESIIFRIYGRDASAGEMSSIVSGAPMQQLLFQSCSRNCVQGTCSGQTCVCNPGRRGFNCEIANLCASSCQFGSCSYPTDTSTGVCTCQTGYQNANCSSPVASLQRTNVTFPALLVASGTTTLSVNVTVRDRFNQIKTIADDTVSVVIRSSCTGQVVSMVNNGIGQRVGNTYVATTSASSLIRACSTYSVQTRLNGALILPSTSCAGNFIAEVSTRGRISVGPAGSGSAFDQQPAVCVLPDSSYGVFFHSNSLSPSFPILGYYYNASGALIREAVQISTSNLSPGQSSDGDAMEQIPSCAVVAGASPGTFNFIVTWYSRSLSRIRAALVSGDASFSPIYPEFSVQETNLWSDSQANQYEQNPSVTASGGTGLTQFTVCWTDANFDPHRVYCRSFHAFSLAPVSGTFRANTALLRNGDGSNGGGFEQNPSVTQLSGNRFAVAFQTQAQSPARIFMGVYQTMTSSLVAEMEVTRNVTYVTGSEPNYYGKGFNQNPTVASHPSASVVVVAWYSNAANAILAQVYNSATLNVTRSAFVVNTSPVQQGVATGGWMQNPSATMLSNGNFFIAWHNARSQSVIGRLFYANGTALTKEVILGTDLHNCLTDPAAIWGAGYDQMVSVAADHSGERILVSYLSHNTATPFVPAIHVATFRLSGCVESSISFPRFEITSGSINQSLTTVVFSGVHSPVAVATVSTIIMQARDSLNNIVPFTSRVPFVVRVSNGTGPTSTVLTTNNFTTIASNPANFPTNFLSISWSAASLSYIAQYSGWFVTNDYRVDVFLNISSTMTLLSSQTMARLGPASILSISPRASSYLANTVVTITGVNFLVNFTTCVINGVARSVVPDDVLNTTTMICRVPPMQINSAIPSTSNIFITSDGGVTFINEPTQSFTYLHVPDVMISPTSGVVLGGTLISIIPVNSSRDVFSTSHASQPRCTFRLVEANVFLSAPATIVSPRLATCVLPSATGVLLSTATLDFDFTLNLQEYASQYSNPANLKFTIIHPASFMCRSNAELPIGVSRRFPGTPYFPNLLSRSTSLLSSIVVDSGNSAVQSNATQLTDDDLCCRYTSSNTDGTRCGVAFIQKPTSARSSSVTIQLRSFVTVTSVVSSFRDGCRNLPKNYTLEYWHTESNRFVTAQTWFTDNQVAVLSRTIADPCAEIPSENGGVSVCINYLNLPPFSNLFRFVFDNSVEDMGAYPTATDGGWLFEIRLHGIANTTTYSLVSNVSSVVIANNLATRNVLPPIAISHFGYQGQRLFAPVSSVKVFAQPSLLAGSQAVIRADAVTEVSAMSVTSQGDMIFQNISLSYLPPGNYTLTFYIPGIVDPSISLGFAVSIIVTIQTGPAAFLQTFFLPPLSATTTPTFSSSQKLLLSPFILIASDQGNNLLSASTTPVPSFNVSLTLAHYVDSVLKTPEEMLGTITNVTLSAGRFTFNNVSIVRPLVGNFVITIRGDGNYASLTPVTLLFNVRAGAASNLLFYTPTLEYQTEEELWLDHIEIWTEDILGNWVEEYTSVLSISCRPSTYFVPVEPEILWGGYMWIDWLSMTAPKPGNYSLTFATTTLSVSFNITVLVGEAWTMVFASPIDLFTAPNPLRSYPCNGTVLVTVPAMTLNALDASGTFVGSSDPTSRLAQVDTPNLSSFAGVASPMTLQLLGTRSAVLVDGVVQFSDLQVAAPRVGVYAYSIIVTDVLTTNVFFAFRITVGAPHALSSPTTFMRFTSTAVMPISPAVVIQVVDIGSNVLGATDIVVRSLSTSLRVTATPNLTLHSSAIVPSSMSGGSTTFSNLVLAAPASTLVWQYCANSGGTCNVPFFPANTVVYGRFALSLNDPFLYVALPQSVSSSSYPCTVSFFPYSSGFPNLAGMKCYYSLSSSASLVFASPSLVSYSLSLMIIPGTPQNIIFDPTRLDMIVTRASTSSLVSLGTINIIAVDISNSTVGGFDSQSRLFAITSTTPLSGASASPLMQQGYVSINSLSLVAPAAGIFTVIFSTNLATRVAQLPLRVTIYTGLPASLVISNINPLLSQFPTEVSVLLPNITVEVLDAGGNSWNRSLCFPYGNSPAPCSTDATINVELSVRSGTTRTVIPSWRYQSSFNTDGVAVLSGMTLSSPEVGSYSLTMLSGSLTSTRFDFNILTGTPAAIQVLEATSAPRVEQRRMGIDVNVSVSIVSDLAVAWQFALGALDAGGSDISEANATSPTFPLTYTIVIQPIGFTGGLSGLRVNSTALGVMQSGTMPTSVSFLRPVVGCCYYFSISSTPFLEPILVAVRVTPGTPTNMTFLSQLPATIDNDGGLLPVSVLVQMLDAVGNNAETSGVVANAVWLPVTAGDFFSPTSPFTAASNNGLLTFDMLNIVGVPGSYYRLVVTSAVLMGIQGATSPTRLRILPCSVIGRPNTSPLPDRSVCLCSPGFEQNTVLECVACALNTFKATVSDIDICQPCAVTKVTSSAGATNALDCQCQSGFFSRTKEAACETCPLGATCPGGDQLSTNDGYWRGTQESTQFNFYECLNPSACLGDEGCGTGYIGPLCNACDQGYSGFGQGVCRECPRNGVSGFLFFMILLVWLSASVWTVRTVIYNALLSDTAKASAAKKDFGSPSAVAPASMIISQEGRIRSSSFDSAGSNVLIGSSRTGSSASGDSNQGSVTKPSAMTTSSAAASSAASSSGVNSSSSSLVGFELEPIVLFKCFITYAQSIAFLAAFQLKWHTAASVLFEVLSIFTLSPNVIPVQCTFHISFYYYFLWFLLLPIFIVIAIVVIVAVVDKIQNEKLVVRRPYFIPTVLQRSQSTGRYTLRQILQKYAVATLIIIIYVLHPSVSRQAFEVFSCTEVNGELHLSGSIMNICGTPTHTFWTVLSATVLQIWIFGGPFYVFYILINNRFKLRDFHIKLRFQFFYAGYSPRYYFYEAVSIGRRLLLVCLIVFGRGSPLTQVAFGLFVLMLSILALIHFKPYESLAHMLLDMWSQVAIYLTLLAGSIVYSTSDLSESYVKDAATAVIVVVNLLVLIMYAFFVVKRMLPAHMTKELDKKLNLRTVDQLRKDHSSALSRRGKMSGNSFNGPNEDDESDGSGGMNMNASIDGGFTSSMTSSAVASPSVPGSGSNGGGSPGAKSSRKQANVVAEEEMMVFSNRNNAASANVTAEDMRSDIAQSRRFVSVTRADGTTLQVSK